MKEAGEEVRWPRTRFRGRGAVSRDIDALLDRLRRASRCGLHLGAGGEKLPGLINCDAHDPRADRRMDGCDLSAFGEASVDWIESHHMIEHLSFAEAERALDEWRRVLCPGGRLVIACPDITAVCRLWLRRCRWAWLRPAPERREYVLRMLCGSQEHPGMFHRSAYDRRRLHRLLRARGFEIEFTFAPYGSRPTPTLLVVSRVMAAGATRGGARRFADR